jgi:carbamoyltransferase
MNILGYAALNHDPSVAILSGSKILYAIESEKITRQKQEVSCFPELAIRSALKSAGISWGEIDTIAVNYDAGPFANWAYLPHLWRMTRARSFDLGVILNNIVIASSHHKRVFNQTREYRVPRIVRVRHHLAHLASTFLYSPFEEAAAAIIDASGEIECTSLYACSGRRIRKLYSMDLPADSLGLVYMMATRHLGYRALGDEYKVMGLAPFGSPNARFRTFFTTLIQLLPSGRYRVGPLWAGHIFDNGWKFPRNITQWIGTGRSPEEELSQEHMDFAFELQRRTQEAILHVLRYLRKITHAKHLCLAGGVALNSVANGKILEEGGFEEVFAPPAPHDAGTSLGAATYYNYYVLRGERPEPLRHAFWGPSYSNELIEGELIRCRQAYMRIHDPSRVAAEHVAAGYVVGWFQGATEFGPRALGNRSILADPRSVDVKHRISRLVKDRDGYRPFAPALLADHVSRYFSHIKQSPFMSFVDRVRPELQRDIAATVHIDGTARPQTVDEAISPAFYRLIKHFYSMTGVPAVLNTSFNTTGEPMVNTPLDALRCFHGSGLEVLIMGDCILQKHSNVGHVVMG